VGERPAPLHGSPAGAERPLWGPGCQRLGVANFGRPGTTHDRAGELPKPACTPGNNQRFRTSRGPSARAAPRSKNSYCNQP